MNEKMWKKKFFSQETYENIAPLHEKKKGKKTEKIWKQLQLKIQLKTNKIGEYCHIMYELGAKFEKNK